MDVDSLESESSREGEGSPLWLVLEIPQRSITVCVTLLFPGIDLNGSSLCQYLSITAVCPYSKVHC